MRRRQLILWLICAAIGRAGTAEELFQAIRAGGPTVQAVLAADQAAVRRTDPRGTTALHYAAAFGSTEPVRFLLAMGADVHARDRQDATPLILAAASPEKVHLLIAAGARPNDRSKSGTTALLIAAGRNGAVSAVRLLLDAGADVNHANDEGTTALLAAAAGGDVETVGLLLKRGARIGATDQRGLTPLTAAIGADAPEVIARLLEAGANVNAPLNITGAGPLAQVNSTPLILAAVHDSATTLRTLMAAGAQPNVQDVGGLTPLMAAATADPPDLEAIALLLMHGADPNAMDANGETVLDRARRAGNSPVIQLLEQAGAQAKSAPESSHGRQQ